MIIVTAYPSPTDFCASFAILDNVADDYIWIYDQITTRGGTLLFNLYFISR